MALCNKIGKKTRQGLVSDVMGGLAFAFKNKADEKRYIKLYNYIYTDLINENLYHRNA